MRLVTLTPEASEALAELLNQEAITYRRVGRTRFMFPDMAAGGKRFRLSTLLRFVAAGHGQTHILEDKYV